MVQMLVLQERARACQDLYILAALYPSQLGNAETDKYTKGSLIRVR